MGELSFASLEIGVDGSEGGVEVRGIDAVIGATSFLLGWLPVEVSEAGKVGIVEGVGPFGVISSSAPCLIEESDFIRIEHFVSSLTNVVDSLPEVLHRQ